MAISLVSRYLAFALLFVFFDSALPLETQTLDADHRPSLPSFSFEGGRSSDAGAVALYGDAEMDDSAVRITRPAISSRGRIVYKKPIRFFGTKPGFSTSFSFSVGAGTGDGLSLGFFMVPSSVRLKPTSWDQPGFSSSVVSVTYGSSRVAINVGSEIGTKSSDLSAINLTLNSGLHSWIDYSGELKRVEVRLSESWTMRPSDSLVAHDIDLSDSLWREAIFVGISSSTGNSTQMTSVHSWNFTVHHGAPYRMHSEPLDPRSFLVKTHEDPPIHPRGAYPWGSLLAFIFGTACGMLAAFVLLYVCPAIFYRTPVAPMEYPELTLESGNEKTGLVGDKGKISAGK